MSEIEDIFAAYHAAADEFSRGDPEPVKAMYSHTDAVVIANPFGPARRGWSDVSEGLDQASSRFRDGEMRDVETISSFITSDMATLHTLEHWHAKVAGRDEVSSFDLRVTTVWRREGGSWKIVLRHADPITTYDPDGPLRS
jgi:ketosteroid isomerase-like protein